MPGFFCGCVSWVPVNFDELLARAAEPTLQELVGRAGVRLLSRLDTGLTQPDRLRQVAVGLRTPQEMLLTAETRRELLMLLPPGQARALVATLGISEGQDPYQALTELRVQRGSQQAATLLAFFGLTELEQPGAALPPTVETVTPAYTLFSHQREATDRVLHSLRTEPYRTLLHMPTGSGKTRTAMHAVARLMNEHEPLLVVWLAHSEELCEQAIGEFTKAWEALGSREVPVRRWWGSHELGAETPADGMLVTSLAKIYKAGQRSVEVIGRVAGRVGLVVMDEAHQAVAPTYRHVLEMLTEAGESVPLLGLTATPGRTWNDIDEDERLAEFFFWQKVSLEVPGYDSPVDYLIDYGYLAKTSFVSLSYSGSVDLTERDRRDLAKNLDVPARVLRQLADDEQRNLMIVTRTEAMLQNHQRLLLFAATVEHARLLATALRARGIRAQAVTGTTSPAERARLIDDYRSNDPEPRVLVNFGVLTAGFDAPRTSAAIIARPTNSLVLYSQMVGRATRGPRAGGNAEAEVRTVVDTALPGFASLTEALHNWEDVWRRRP